MRDAIGGLLKNNQIVFDFSRSVFLKINQKIFPEEKVGPFKKRGTLYANRLDKHIDIPSSYLNFRKAEVTHQDLFIVQPDLTKILAERCIPGFLYVEALLKFRQLLISPFDLFSSETDFTYKDDMYTTVRYSEDYHGNKLKVGDLVVRDGSSYEYTNSYNLGLHVVTSINTGTKSCYTQQICVPYCNNLYDMLRIVSHNYHVTNWIKDNISDTSRTIYIIAKELINVTYLFPFISKGLTQAGSPSLPYTHPEEVYKWRTS